MFTVETLKDGVWKPDRKYKVFDNAENRLYALYAEGINARMVEKKK